MAQSPPDPAFDTKVADIRTAHLSAQEQAMAGERTISLDEMTGIQALERKAPDLPMRPGKIVRRELNISVMALTSWHSNLDCQF
jgi:hypothetical protein